MADTNAPIDVIGTGSFIPENWSETYATADIVEYDGVPLVKLVPVPKERKPLVPGRYKGKIWIAPDCFEPMSEEELDLWEQWDH